MRGLTITLALLFLAYALAGGLACATTTVKLTYMADLHLSEGPNSGPGTDSLKAKIRDELTLVGAFHPNALLLGGDLSHNTDNTSFGQSNTLIKTFLDSFYVATGIPVYISLGNHDVDIYNIDTTPPDTIVAGHDPYAATMSYLAAYCPCVPPSHWYAEDFYPNVRVLCLLDDCDTTVNFSGANWEQINANCNPPGKNQGYFGGTGNSGYTNPDFSGYSDTTSRQSLWARGAIEDGYARGDNWMICMQHESIYPPYANSENTRVVQRRLRNALPLSLINHGVKLFLGGHHHVDGVIGPVKGSFVDATGAYFVTLTSSGYAARTVSNALLPANSIQWSPTLGTIDGTGYLCDLTINGNKCFLEMWRFHHTGTFIQHERVDTLTIFNGTNPTVTKTRRSSIAPESAFMVWVKTLFTTAAQGITKAYGGLVSKHQGNRQ